MEPENNGRISLLDCSIFRINNKFETSLSRKNTFSGLGIFCIKWSVIAGLLLEVRYYRPLIQPVITARYCMPVIRGSLLQSFITARYCRPIIRRSLLQARYYSPLLQAVITGSLLQARYYRPLLQPVIAGPRSGCGSSCGPASSRRARALMSPRPSTSGKRFPCRVTRSVSCERSVSCDTLCRVTRSVSCDTLRVV